MHRSISTWEDYVDAVKKRLRELHKRHHMHSHGIGAGICIAAIAPSARAPDRYLEHLDQLVAGAGACIGRYAYLPTLWRELDRFGLGNTQVTARVYGKRMLAARLQWLDNCKAHPPICQD